MKFVDTFEFHKSNPEQAPHDYYRSLRIKLSEQVLDKKVIYLDTKYWVLMRKGLLEPNDYPLENVLLKLAIELSSQGQCVFPISEDVFLEVIKQTDERTLKATADLIDQLSQGISSISSEERIKLELLHYWYSITGKCVYRTEQLVWTKLSYLMGMQQFEMPEVSEDDNRMIQKSFMDQMWSISLNQMITIIENSEGVVADLHLKIADKLNDGKFKHSDEAKTFNQMFLNEVGGIIDVYRDDLADMMSYMYSQETGLTETEDEFLQHRNETKKLMGNTIYNIFRLKKVTVEMPSINILSSLHAAVRWDKQQKFQDNDFYDFRHATTALPYCDYFFTEKRLMHLLTQKSLSFDKLYNCEVQSNVSKVITSLKGLLVEANG
jgi:hypothetical protein